MTSPQPSQSDDTWPKGTSKPAPQDCVQILTTEEMAREFERRMLTGYASLAGPIVFSEDDLPTYIIQPESR